MTKMPRIHLFTLIMGLSIAAFAAGSKAPASKIRELSLELGAPFQDSAILQRDMKVPIWGWSKAGTAVTVTFAGQKKDATSGKDGKWMVELDPLKASFEPRDLVISEKGGTSETLKNVLVGEVWMASGQSNMKWTCAKSSCNQLKVEAYGEKKINPIREFELSNCTSQLHPIEKAKGAWKDGNYSDYSAIAFAFAHKLYHELNVPIAILNCSWSQTAIQAWVPRVGFATAEDDYSKAIHQRCLETDPTTPEHKAAWDAYYKEVETAMKEGKAVPRGLPGNLSGNRDASWLFNGRLNPVVPFAIRGAIWNQGYANSGEGIPYYNNLHSLIRGWRLVWNRPELPVYFHQFYCPGSPSKPSIGGTSEMRLGTWLARDIPNADMASQIDISGAIHYGNKAVPGQRLALHALKNQYGKDVIANGPMYKGYKVDGDKVIVEFDHADGGLVVADTAFNRSKEEGATGFANPKEIPNGEDKVTLFWLAGEDKVWHPATFKIDGSKVIVNSSAVKAPRGISYGSGGIGFQPCLYNKALLPMTPFIYYDSKLVTSKPWPGIDSIPWPKGKLKIVGETINPASVGELYEWRKLPILPPQFRENGVLQAGVPITFWGSTQKYGESGGAAEGKAEIHFEFGDVKKTIPVTPGMDEWSLTLDPMKATDKPRTLKVSFIVDGKLYHERICPGIVIGDVWYVAAPAGTADKKTNKKNRKDGDPVPKDTKGGAIVRMLANQSKRSTKDVMSRYSVAVSRTPKNRFASFWKPATGFAGELGAAISAKTGNPVGIIFMQNKPPKGGGNPGLNSWIHYDYLQQAPSLMNDYKVLASKYQGTEYYNENVKKYLAAWKDYWGTFIPQMMTTKGVPDGASWGWYPTFKADGKSDASQTYNVVTHCFTPAGVKGAVFLTYPEAVAENEGAVFGEQMSALGNCWIGRFGSEPTIVYALPGKELAPKATKATSIKGKSLAVEITDWKDYSGLIQKAVETVYGK